MSRAQNHGKTPSDAKKMHTGEPLCPTCRHNELRHYILVDRPKEGRGCTHHIVRFPDATVCARYEREHGVDDVA